LKFSCCVVQYVAHHSIANAHSILRSDHSSGCCSGYCTATIAATGKAMAGYCTVHARSHAEQRARAHVLALCTGLALLHTTKVTEGRHRRHTTARCAGHHAAPPCMPYCIGWCSNVCLHGSMACSRCSTSCFVPRLPTPCVGLWPSLVNGIIRPSLS